MSSIDHLDPMISTMRSHNATFAQTNHMTPPADPTIASAWSSSALGDPATDDGYIADRAEFPPDPISPAAKRWPLGRNAVVAAAVIAAIGAAAVSVGLAIVTTSGSDQPKPATVVPGAAVVPAPPASVVPPPAAVAPASPPVLTPPDSGQPASGSGSPSGNVGSGNATDPSPVGAPSGGPAQSDPGSPPASAPDGPSVNVNIPIVPVPVPVPVPVLVPGGPQNGGPQNGGPQKGGPQKGGPQNGGPQNGGPQKGGPQNGGPQNGGPQKGVIKTCLACKPLVPGKP
jgi:hypothetical protein